MNILRFYLLNISVVLLEASFLATGLLHEKDNCPSSNQIDSAQVDRDSDLDSTRSPSNFIKWNSEGLHTARRNCVQLYH